MIHFDEVIFRNIIAHKVDIENSELILSNEEYRIKDSEESLLKNIFIRPFGNVYNTFEFNHEINLDYNVLFNLSKNIYDGRDFYECSIDIVNHLSSISKHFKINNGEIYITKLESIKIQDTYYEGLGIYKFDSKDFFIETKVNKNKFEILTKYGIGSKKPEKACLVIFTKRPYTILIVDASESDYWQHEFIKAKSKNDAVNYTNDFLSITKNYLTKQINEEFEIEKADKIDLLNRSVEYFKKNEVFDRREFEQEVLQDNNLVESFRNYKETYEQQNDIKIEDSFEISTQAVKKQARVFKSVLKLDKNFHIYIHGNREMIERGVDEAGRKFYKIYYQNEE